MQAQQNNSNLLDTLSQDFKGQSIYGLEFILDEFIEQRSPIKSDAKEITDVDWFGLSDLCI